MGNPTTTCRWVMAGGAYCEVPVDYIYVTEDDGVRHREYKSFCPHHEERAAILADEDEDLA